MVPPAGMGIVLGWWSWFVWRLGLQALQSLSLHGCACYREQSGNAVAMPACC